MENIILLGNLKLIWYLYIIICVWIFNIYNIYFLWNIIGFNLIYWNYIRNLKLYPILYLNLYIYIF